MAEPIKRHLRILRLRRGVEPDRAIRFERLREITAEGVLGAGGRILVVDPDLDPREPAWLPFLEDAAAEPIPSMASPLRGAILIVRAVDRWWLLTFGTGHLFVSDDFAEPRFGLRTVLNLVDPNQLRSVGSRVYEDVVIRTMRQVSRRSGRDAFTIDDTRDLLRDVTGAPRDTATWGTEVTGGIAFSLTVPIDVADLRGLLDRIATAHDQVTYRTSFAFVDAVQAVSDPALVATLDADALDAVAARKASDIYLAPPEPILYEDLAGFLFFREQIGDVHPELDIGDYRRRIADPNALTIDNLRSHAVRMISASTGGERRSWSIHRCLVYETEIAGRNYLLSEGEWFEIEPDFVARVDADVATILPTGLALPPAIRGETEAAYNQRAAATLGFAMMDRKLVSVGGTTIEVADLISPAGEFIHVKRKTQSATLSHLFSQGRIAAETLKADASARLQAQAHLNADGRVPAAILDDPYDARGMTVVYAVIADNAAGLPGGLPFFSRLNLWHARRDLVARLDYQLAFAGVPLT